jgi:hypothetical protein
MHTGGGGIISDYMYGGGGGIISDYIISDYIISDYIINDHFSFGTGRPEGGSFKTCKDKTIRPH